MEEPKVITIGDVMDSTVMHINKGNAHGTQGERSNPDNSNEYLLLATLIRVMAVPCVGIVP